MSGAWRPVLASLPCRNRPESRLWDVWPKFGIPPTVAERSKPKRGRPGKNSTLNPGTGGSNEKAISRKRSAGRVGLSGAGGIRCRTAGAIYTTAAAGSGLHLDRVLRRCERRYFIRNEHP